MRSILEDYSYADFKEHHQRWLNSGRQLWFVTGNFGHQEAVDLVENARSEFDLSSIKLEDLAGIRATAVEDGHSFHIE